GGGSWRGRRWVGASEATAGEPGAVLSAVNTELREANEALMFTTLLAGRLRLADGLVELANAGHPPPFHVGANGTIAPLACEAHLPLGAWPGQTYPTMRLQLAAGDGLFVYTDGITEATAVGGTQYSAARLHAALGELGRLPGRELLSALVANVRTFAGEAPQADDIAALVLRWRPMSTGTSAPCPTGAITPSGV